MTLLLMTTRVPKNNFDGIAFKRMAQAEMYEQMRSMTVRQQLDSLRERPQSGALADWWMGRWMRKTT
jgi:hypothetical protein